MVRVLMVCLGNICRSPLAEGILKSKVDSKSIFIDSSGTGGWHIGELPDSRSIEVARLHQLDITDQRCRKFTVQDFQDFDIIYVMDRSNYSDVVSLAKSSSDKAKVKMILDELFPGESRDVPDPYYGGERGFEKVYTLLDEACDQIANRLNHGN